MRIAFVVETWLPSTDGIITRLTATMRELTAAGHQVLVIAPRGRADDGHDVRLSGVTVRTVPTAGVAWLYGGQRWGLPAPRVGRFLREFRPDVVHVANPAWLGIAGVVAATRQRLPLVASYHTDLTQHVPHYLGRLVPVIWWLLRRLHGRATVNLATSHAAIDNLGAHGIPDVRLWPRGVDLELFGSTARSQPDERRRPVALYVGRLAGEKGLHRLAPLADPGSGFDLELIGDGPQRAELSARFASRTVRFLGVVRGTALAQAYRDADVFVFPSTTETLGLVLLEALASGLPIVAVDSPASREVLAGCPLARLYPADRPGQLLALARELAAQPPGQQSVADARHQAQRWSWAEATATLLTYYRLAIGRVTPAEGPVPPARTRDPDFASS